MLLATGLYNQNIKFFEISWSDKDQVSNVKIVKQTLNTLKLVFSYLFKKAKFLEKEHREIVYEDYESTILYNQLGKGKNE